MSNQINYRNACALILNLCVGIIFTSTSGYAVEDEILPVSRMSMQGGRPVPEPMPPIVQCPAPVTVTIQGIVPTTNNGDFSAAQWANHANTLNDSATNRPVLVFFPWLPPSKNCCQLTNATLTINMRANEGGASSTTGKSDAGNDAFAVMNMGLVVAPYSGAVYSQLPFSSGQLTTKILNITGAALTKIENGGGLSLYVQDDTAVVSATLQIKGCCLKTSHSAVLHQSPPF